MIFLMAVVPFVRHSKLIFAKSFDIELIENLETGVPYRRTKVIQKTFINLHFISLSFLKVFI